MKNARAKRAKILFFIVKYANLWGFCCRRRRGWLSSLMLAKHASIGRAELNAENKSYSGMLNSSSKWQIGVLAMMTEPARKTSLEYKHLRNCDYFAIISSCLHFNEC